MISRWTSVPLAVGLAVSLASAAAAGNLGEPVPAAPLAPPVSAPPPSGDWQGGYAGLQFIYSDVDADSGNDEGGVAGLHAGYRWDLGKQVLGVEVDYSQPNIEFDGEDLDYVVQLKGQYGVDFGRTLAYATAGLAPADSSLGEETGWVLGAGVDYAISPSFTLGAEVTYQDFNEFGSSGVGAEAATAGLRASFRF